MSIAAIWSIVNTLLLLGIIGYLIVINKYLNKNDIVDYVAQIFKTNKSNLKRDLDLFLKEVKKEYTHHQEELLTLLQEQQKEVEQLKKIILNETEVFKKYCQNRITFQENFIKEFETKLQNATNKISQLENQLKKCRNKLKKVKNGTKTS